MQFLLFRAESSSLTTLTDGDCNGILAASIFLLLYSCIFVLVICTTRSPGEFRVVFWGDSPLLRCGSFLDGPRLQDGVDEGRGPI